MWEENHKDLKYHGIMNHHFSSELWPRAVCELLALCTAKICSSFSQDLTAFTEGWDVPSTNVSVPFCVPRSKPRAVYSQSPGAMSIGSIESIS